MLSKSLMIHFQFRETIQHCASMRSPALCLHPFFDHVPRRPRTAFALIRRRLHMIASTNPDEDAEEETESNSLDVLAEVCVAELERLEREGLIVPLKTSGHMECSKNNEATNRRTKPKRPISGDEAEEQRISKKQKKQGRDDDARLNNSSSTLPLEFKKGIMEMNGSNEKLLIEKEMYETDLSESHGRLMIPQMRLVNKDFLTSDEENRLVMVGGGSKKGKKKDNVIEAVVLDPLFRRHKVKLTRWVMGKSVQYALVSGWNNVLKANGFKKGDAIQLWAFRSNSNLCFALVRV